jgi:hypothetical protein
LVMRLWPMMIRSNGFSTTFSAIAALLCAPPERLKILVSRYRLIEGLKLHTK